MPEFFLYWDAQKSVKYGSVAQINHFAPFAFAAAQALSCIFLF